MRTGTANLPLHSGKCPRWLFDRMVRLSRAIVEVIVEEYGPEEVLRRISDPYWFQALGAVLGFDWHSSGVTTTVCGALKEGLKEAGKSLGIFVVGGKGKASRQTPGEIEARIGAAGLGLDPGELAYTSRLVAKVDNAAVQDGYQLYHHTFLFTSSGKWAVVQQGMDAQNRWARRYHWLGREGLDLVVEPHAAVCCDKRGASLNMVHRGSEAARRAVVEITRCPPQEVMREIRLLKTRTLDLPAHHYVPEATRLEKVLRDVAERQVTSFQDVLAVKGVGPQTVRALALVAEVCYGARPSFEDPARYSFAHGGKDGHPYPVNRRVYDQSIEFLRSALQRARVARTEKLEGLRRLSIIY